ncbi:unnamed protein product [marine sediment metagenome]|uniref:Uncharacterized protein n=1 Tax=marine sediment metagenome TaxID=412755 RepID=X1UJJ1_9ZZZZ
MFDIDWCAVFIYTLVSFIYLGFLWYYTPSPFICQLFGIIR